MKSLEYNNISNIKVEKQHCYKSLVELKNIARQSDENNCRKIMQSLIDKSKKKKYAILVKKEIGQTRDLFEKLGRVKQIDKVNKMNFKYRYAEVYRTMKCKTE